MGCVGDSDCTDLGQGYECEGGFCRAGSQLCREVSLPAGDQDGEVQVNGQTRTYIMHVPSGYSGSEPTALLLDFHAMGAQADMERDSSGFAELSDELGFVVVWPQGIDNTWDLGPCCALSEPAADDFAFVRALVRKVSSEACIDPNRVYATGFSLGGGMAYYLACKQAEIFAAVAASSMDLFADAETECQPSRPVSVISFRGADDTVVPYGGGISGPPGYPDMLNDRLGAVGTFEKWAALDQCTGSPTDPDPNSCSTYTTCEEGAEVTLCTIEDGVQVTGDASVAWEMLERHPMP